MPCSCGGNFKRKKDGKQIVKYCTSCGRVSSVTLSSPYKRPVQKKVVASTAQVELQIPTPQEGQPISSKKIDRNRVAVMVFIAVVAVFGFLLIYEEKPKSSYSRGPGDLCKDGATTYSKGTRGACSHHGGLR